MALLQCFGPFFDQLFQAVFGVAAVRRGPSARLLPPVYVWCGRCTARRRRQPFLARREWDARYFPCSGLIVRPRTGRLCPCERPHGYATFSWRPPPVEDGSWPGAYKLVNGCAIAMCSGCIDQQSRSISIHQHYGLGAGVNQRSHRAFAVLQSFLGLLPFGNVFDHANGVCWSARFIMHQGNRQLSPHCLPVFAEIAFFYVEVRDFAAQRRETRGRSLCQSSG